MPLAAIWAGKGGEPLGEALESASRETCQRVTTERANGVFRNGQVGACAGKAPGLASPFRALDRDDHDDAARVHDL